MQWEAQNRQNKIKLIGSSLELAGDHDLQRTWGQIPMFRDRQAYSYERQFVLEAIQTASAAIMPPAFPNTDMFGFS